MMGRAQLESLRRIAPLAWPVLVGQLAVLAFSTIDTVLVARYSAVDLAALAVGSAIFITVFVGLMGVVLAISPIVGRLFGAGQLKEAGAQLHQTLWLCLGLMVLGSLILLLPEPFLAVSQASPEVEAKVRHYLMALAASLPATLFFTAFRGFNVAVSRPKAVMALQVGGLLLKLPLSLLLIQGFALGPWQVPALGAFGCGLATAIAMWAQAAIAFAWMRRDPFYEPFGLRRGGLQAPQWPDIRALLKLGVPMGGSILIEVTGFTFMAIFIARLGATPVAGHQLAVNLISLMFMLPLALANATGTLVAQSVGAHDPAGARRLGWHGLEIGLAASFLIGALVFFARESVLGLYTSDPRDPGRRPALAALGLALPRGRCRADPGRFCAARPPHRYRAHGHLRAGDLGRGPGRRLLAGLRPQPLRAGGISGRSGFLVGRYGRPGAGRAGPERLPGLGPPTGRTRTGQCWPQFDAVGRLNTNTLPPPGRASQRTWP